MLASGAERLAGGRLRSQPSTRVLAGQPASLPRASAAAAAAGGPRRRRAMSALICHRCRQQTARCRLAANLPPAVALAAAAAADHPRARLKEPSYSLSSPSSSSSTRCLVRRRCCFVPCCFWRHSDPSYSLSVSVDSTSRTNGSSSISNGVSSNSISVMPRSFLVRKCTSVRRRSAEPVADRQPCDERQYTEHLDSYWQTVNATTTQCEDRPPGAVQTVEIGLSVDQPPQRIFLTHLSDGE